MTWIIFKQPHVLDKVWNDARAALREADSAMDGLGDNYTDEQINAAGAVRMDAIQAILALPARNISDSLYKLDCCGIHDCHLINDCDPSAIMDEARDLLNAAVVQGQRLVSAERGILTV